MVTPLARAYFTALAMVPTGNGPAAMAVDARGIWVSNQFDGTLVRIDPGRNQVAQRVSVGSRVSGLAMSGDAVLVAVPHSGAGHRGGTLVLRTNGRRKKGDADSIDSIDFALSGYTYVLPLLRMTGDGLTAFNQVSGLAGTQPVPDLATSLPEPTDGGRTYTFQLRPGIRYSTGRPVQATDFRSTFERFYALGSPATDYDGIVGGAQCRKHPKRCDLSRGIVANNAARTVTFHLVRPDPYFLYTLAAPFAYVLPAGTPFEHVFLEEFWTNHAGDLRPNDQVDVPDDARVDQIVTAAEPAFAGLRGVAEAPECYILDYPARLWV